jgi:hypothetical protein
VLVVFILLILLPSFHHPSDEIPGGWIDLCPFGRSCGVGWRWFPTRSQNVPGVSDLGI